MMDVKRMINHIQRWNKWRKYNYNSLLHKLLVLLHVIYSPTFEFTFTDAEELKIEEAFMRGFNDGCNNIKSKDKI